MARELLSQNELATLAAELTAWEVSGSELRRTFRFGNFVEAFGFMAAAALVAEKMDHHPNWSNVYSTVDVALNTHDRGGVTELDAALARAMNGLAGSAG
ncbi:4a-hydroxytetrahydrobiopterin dehydratase [Candidatus Poriferisodalis sp.]|uniref:4a-hydroxytetrahydrobiopterin dehydratase n=1 Tax=Candidatus Poriferisodalis sp. TaxID=3101277 RepID=UPI003B5169CB